MFFDDLENIETLAQKSGFTIFVVPKLPENFTKENNKNHLVICPDENNQIKIEQIREIIEKCTTHQSTDFYIYVFHAETMNEKAENAFLKLLEEPAENYHFALFTNSTSPLLPTILSRGDLYIQRIKNPLSQPVEASETVKKYAKRIISAQARELPALANEITTCKDAKKNVRGFALSICEAAIEILYKSYFSTNNPAFLKKLPGLLTAYDNLKQNGHIKLHLVADLC